MKKRIKLFTKILLSEGFDPDAEFEILTTAKQTDSRYGEFQYSKSELEQVAENFNNEVVGTEVPVDHDHRQGSDGVALAWLKPGSAHVAPSKKLQGEHSLYIKLHRYTPKGEEFVSTGALRYFSVELQFKFEKMVAGAKKVFKNVLRGLALTNYPVVKDMSPTYSDNPHNPNNMDTLQKAFYGLMAKDCITKAEFAKFSEDADKAVSDGGVEQAKADEMKSEVEANVDEEAAKKAEEEAAKAKADAEVDEAAKKALSEVKEKNFTLSEVEAIVKKAVAEPMKAMNSLLDQTRSARLSEKVGELMLSEKKTTGFKPAEKDKVLAFVKKLSNELAEEYFNLHENIVTSVDLSEHGLNPVNPSDPEGNALAEFEEKAKELASKEGISLAEANRKVLSENPELAAKLS
jgi:hypothetical protein